MSAIHFDVKGRVTIELPWPPKELSPNFRGHWRPIADAKRKYRSDARLLAHSALKHADGISRFEPIRLSYEFFPPDVRAYDRDNLAARMKAATDGIADALRMNDAGFHFAPAVLREKVKGGLVRVTIEQVEP
ncbi:endonuclease [Bordetella sp. 15P40C-2]|uniref:endonuclease n=1 Tax=Bordetella sp. 15P40C-2 TaxID=2572246 RepID=UPI001323688B|nr:endonuclease [Bordetella sp. 15P40C-2]MVW72148.1 endonuclease [Bordetella sp. 15P40C-2]